MKYSSIISILILAAALSQIQSSPLESNLSENDKDALNEVVKGLLNFNKESPLGKLIGKESEELSRFIREPSGSGDSGSSGGSGSSSASSSSSSIVNFFNFRQMLSSFTNSGILTDLLRLVLQLVSAILTALLGDGGLAGILGTR